MIEIPPVINQSDVFRLMSLLRQSQRIVLCAHRGPDGDAVGSSLGLSDYLSSLGKQVNIILPNPFPDFLKWMPGSKDIIFFDEKEVEATRLIDNANLIIMLDFCALDRLQNMQAAVAKANAPRIMIDHHLNPDKNIATLVISHPSACSTSEIVFRLIWQLGGYDSLTRSGAACIYTGMMTDTGGFTYSSKRPEIYYIIGQLLQKGIDKDRIYRNVNNNYSEHRLRFVGYVLNEKLIFYNNHHASIFTITRQEMKKFQYIRGDAEGLVNMPLQVRGMKLSISLREDTEKDCIRVSLRSVDNFPCNKMAEEFFNGGGHLNASGGELPFPLDSAIKTAEKAIDKYKDYFTNK